MDPMRYVTDEAYRASVDALATIGVGMTRVVREQVVTRWSQEAFEVGTWGRDSYSIGIAASVLA